jgi:OOP family OmpA-OmpF porin
MAVSESLFSSTQNFLSPDIIQKFSAEIQQPIDKTKACLKSIIPTVLMGIISKGATPEGAESLVNLANKQGPTVSLDSINQTQSIEVVNGIFGNNTNDVVTKLGLSTGLNSTSITKILGMVSPMIMGVLGSKIKSEKLNASGLMNFLAQQKSSLVGMVPASVSGLFGGLASARASVSSTTGAVQEQIAKGSSWGKIGLAALVALGLLWWFNARQTGVKMIPTPSRVLTQVKSPPPVVEVTQALSGLDNFMSSATAGMMKRFRFEHLNFETGTTALMTGSEIELNQIAETLKKYPAATIKIEGFTDNIGQALNNLALSTSRALEVKNELVARGIEAKRIEATGLGSASPIATNTTAEGRAENRRIELIVKRQ